MCEANFLYYFISEMLKLSLDICGVFYLNQDGLGQVLLFVIFIVWPFIETTSDYICVLCADDVAEDLGGVCDKDQPLGICLRILRDIFAMWLKILVFFLLSGFDRFFQEDVAKSLGARRRILTVDRQQLLSEIHHQLLSSDNNYPSPTPDPTSSPTSPPTYYLSPDADSATAAYITLGALGTLLVTLVWLCKYHGECADIGMKRREEDADNSVVGCCCSGLFNAILLPFAFFQDGTHFRERYFEVTVAVFMWMSWQPYQIMVQFPDDLDGCARILGSAMYITMPLLWMVWLGFACDIVGKSSNDYDVGFSIAMIVCAPIMVCKNCWDLNKFRNGELSSPADMVNAIDNLGTPASDEVPDSDSSD